MDIAYWINFGLGASLAGALSWIGCRWWYGRQLTALNLRLQKTEKARLFAAQQTNQARKQIATLQKALSKQQHDAVA